MRIGGLNRAEEEDAGKHTMHSIDIRAVVYIIGMCRFANSFDVVRSKRTSDHKKHQN